MNEDFDAIDAYGRSALPSWYKEGVVEFAIRSDPYVKELVDLGLSRYAAVATLETIRHPDYEVPEA